MTSMTIKTYYFHMQREECFTVLKSNFICSRILSDAVTPCAQYKATMEQLMKPFLLENAVESGALSKLYGFICAV